MSEFRYRDYSDQQLDKAIKDHITSIDGARRAARQFELDGRDDVAATWRKALATEEAKLKDLQEESARRMTA